MQQVDRDALLRGNEVSLHRIETLAQFWLRRVATRPLADTRLAALAGPEPSHPVLPVSAIVIYYAHNNFQS